MAEQKANLFTKYGMIRMLLLRRHSEENLQCQTDLDNLINEFEVSDPIEREFTGVYQEIDYTFVVSIQVKKEGLNRYSLWYNRSRTKPGLL